jgi:hypothetical protein
MRKTGHIHEMSVGGSRGGRNLQQHDRPRVLRVLSLNRSWLVGRSACTAG